MTILLASYPKSGSTWVRAFITNLILDRPAPATLDEITNTPFIIGPTTPSPPTTGVTFRKTHDDRDPSSERHLSPDAVIYIARPRDQIIPSYAAHLGWSITRTAQLVRSEHPVHLESWINHVDFLIQYDRLPDQFYALADWLKAYFYIEGDPARAIRHSSFRILQADERQNGFAEASTHTPFFRKGPPQ